MEGETKNIRFVLKIYRFVLRLLNISFCGLYIDADIIFTDLMQMLESISNYEFDPGSNTGRIDGRTSSIVLPDNIITNILFGRKKSISFPNTDFDELKSLITAE